MWGRRCFRCAIYAYANGSPLRSSRTLIRTITIPWLFIMMPFSFPQKIIYYIFKLVVYYHRSSLSSTPFLQFFVQYFRFFSFRASYILH